MPLRTEQVIEAYHIRQRRKELAISFVELEKRTKIQARHLVAFDNHRRTLTPDQLKSVTVTLGLSLNKLNDLPPVVFGWNFNRIRKNAKLKLSQLHKETRISLSYLSELESGKKIPTPEKLRTIARVLGAAVEDFALIDENARTLLAVLESPMLQSFPFGAFGIRPHQVIDIVQKELRESVDLVKLFQTIGRNYDVQNKEVFYMAMRHQQKEKGNYFSEIEDAVHDFCDVELGWFMKIPTFDEVKAALENKYQCKVDTETITNKKDLKTIRSLYRDDNGLKTLYINDKLSTCQQAFIIAREIGFQSLAITERASYSPKPAPESFDHVFNNFRASYFSGAVLMPEMNFTNDLASFFQRETWCEQAFRGLLRRYPVTSENFAYRMTEILPRKLGLTKLFFMKFSRVIDPHDEPLSLALNELRHKSGESKIIPEQTFQNLKERFGPPIVLTKRLDMSDLIMPRGAQLNEFFCRRFVATSIFRDLEKELHKEDGEWEKDELPVIVKAQTIAFHKNGQENPEPEYLCISMAYPFSLNPNRLSSVTVGIKLDDRAKSIIRFLKKPPFNAVNPSQILGTTCERCPIGLGKTPGETGACDERVVDGYQQHFWQEEDTHAKAISKLFSGENDKVSPENVPHQSFKDKTDFK